MSLKPKRVIVIPLGEMPRAVVEERIARELGLLDITWLDRRELRRSPWRVVPRLLQRRYVHAILVAPGLDQRRLRLTSFVLMLPRARRRWRIDVHGKCERWSLAGHFARHALPIIRHFAACGLALVLGEALLKLLDR
ncbi:MAG TPA: hypothetical protein VK898_08525, partial [Chloroflexota bacterium]|nr:hypothetical protein [Chloroflexota bacterium]